MDQLPISTYIKYKKKTMQIEIEMAVLKSRQTRLVVGILLTYNVRPYICFSSNSSQTRVESSTENHRQGAFLRSLLMESTDYDYNI